MNSNRSYRVRTEVGQNSPNVLNVKIDNSFDILEILSLKLDQENLYHLPKSNYGVIIGRVIANKGFGVPNAKISVFIPKDSTEELTPLYTYSSPFSNGSDGVRYNLLPSMVNEECHQDVGTFFTKKTLLDNNTVIEIFEKYYRYTTTTNSAGDFFLSGVPTGMQQVHMDLDMSDCGVLSQTPRDMIYKGYNINQFESNVQFKKSTNLNNLAQIFTQNKSIYVYPFWGDTTDEDTNSTITRCDIEIDYEFEPTCIFMGSVITDTGDASLSKKCQPDIMLGKMSNMVTGEGSIEMIRKTPNGKVEEYSVKGQKLIDGNGVWCYQIPMNLDYVTTDEFGNLVASDNPNKGIATRTRVRFRISMMDIDDDSIARKRARYLVPNNPLLDSTYYPEFNRNHEFDYEFGSLTADENFRDLYWNKVYTVKSYIPRLQKKTNTKRKNFTGIKAVNHYGDNNPMPYNNIQIKFNFAYRFMCTLLMFTLVLVAIINRTISPLGVALFKVGRILFRVGKMFSNGEPDAFIENRDDSVNDNADNGKGKGLMTAGCRLMRTGLSMCIGFESDLCDEIGGLAITTFYPGITPKFYELKMAPGSAGNIIGDNENYGNACIENGWFQATNNDPLYTDISGIMNCIENSLAAENEVISFNFHNDWVNGVLYFPLWMRVIRPKKKFFFNLFTRKAKDTYCNASRSPKGRGLKIYQPCAPIRELDDNNRESLPPLFNGYQGAAYNPNGLGGGGGHIYMHTNRWLDITDYYMGIGNESNGYRFKSHKKTIGMLKTDNGIIVERETKLGQYVYYYSCGEYQEARGGAYPFQSGTDVIKTLFATDIVLLGSLDKCDSDGVPQFFKELPSTTYNMPPSLLSLDYEVDDTGDIPNSVNSTDEDRNDDIMEAIKPETLHTEYSGADWGDSSYDLHYDNRPYHPFTLFPSGYDWTIGGMIRNIINFTHGNTTRPISIPVIPGGEQFDNGGLFYGITCNSSYVKPKSCINLSRQCEFGVTLDQSIDIPGDLTRVENDNSYGLLLPDGFISYDEIANHDGRSMFATMNYDLLKYRFDERTGYKKVDFRHKTVDNFDGSLSRLMKNEHGGYGNPSPNERNYVDNYKLETASRDYLNFRFGDKNVNYYRINGRFLGKPVDKRIPQYRNSFYFYFGLKEGKTAIDRFKAEYYGTCPANSGEYAVKVKYRANEWCINEPHSGAYVALYARDIVLPYTVSFLNNDDLTAEVIDSDGYIENEKVYFASEPIEELESEGYFRVNKHLPNAHYTVTIVDAESNVTNIEIAFVVPVIDAQVGAINFTKTNDELFNDPNIDYSTIANDTTTIDSTSREIGGCIAISNINTNSVSDVVRVKVAPANPSDFPSTDPLGIYTGFEYRIVLGSSYSGWYDNQGTAVGNMGKIKYDETIDTFLITLPKGGVSYKVTLISLCDDEETENQTISNVYVDEGSNNILLVNDIDYRLFSNFESGVDNDGVFDSSDIRGWVDIDNLSYSDSTNFTPQALVQTKLIDRLSLATQPSGGDVVDTAELLSSETVTGSNSSYRWTSEYRLPLTDLPVDIQSYESIPTTNDGLYIYYEYNLVNWEQYPRPEDWVFSDNDTYATINDSNADDTFHTWRRIGTDENNYVYRHYTIEPHKELYKWNGTSYEQVLDGDNNPVSDYQDDPNFDYAGYYDGMDGAGKESWIELINECIDKRYDVVMKMKDAFWIQDYQEGQQDNDGNTLLLSTIGYDIPYTKVIKYTDYMDNLSLPVQPTPSVQQYETTSDNKPHIWYPLVDMSDNNTLIWNNKLPYAVGVKCGNGTKLPTTINPNTDINTTNKTEILSQFTKVLYMNKTFDFRYVCWGETGDTNSGFYRVWDYDARPSSVTPAIPGSNSLNPIVKNGIFAIAIENGIINSDIDYNNNARVNFISQKITNTTTNVETELNICNFRDYTTNMYDTESRMPTRRTLVEDFSLIDESITDLANDSNTNPTLNNYRVWENDNNGLQLQTFPRSSTDCYSVEFTHHYMGDDVQIDELQGVNVKPGLKVSLEGSLLTKNSYYDDNLSSIIDMNNLANCIITPHINSDELNINVTYYLMLHEYDAVLNIPINNSSTYNEKKMYMEKNPYINHYKCFDDSHSAFQYDNIDFYFGEVMKPYNVFTFAKRNGFFIPDPQNPNPLGLEFTDESGNIVTLEVAEATSLVIGKCTNGREEDIPHSFDLNALFGEYSLPGVSRSTYDTSICSSALFYVIAKDDESRTLAASPLIDMIDWQAQLVYYNSGNDIVLRIHKPSLKTSINTPDDALRYYYYFTKPLVISPTKDDESYFFEVDIPTCSAQQINRSGSNWPRWWEITLYSGGTATTSGITFINDSQKTMADVRTYWQNHFTTNINNDTECQLYFRDIIGVGHYSEHIPVVDNTTKWSDDILGGAYPIYYDGTTGDY